MSCERYLVPPFLYSSLSNREESKLVVELVKVLIDSGAVPTKMGIITPYKDQENLIRDQLSKRWAGHSVVLVDILAMKGVRTVLFDNNYKIRSIITH